MIGWLIALAVLWGVIPGFSGAWLARNRGRNPWIWFLFSACLPLALFLLVSLPPLREVRGRYRRCPECGMLIPWERQHCFDCDLTRQANEALHGPLEDEDEETEAESEGLPNEPHS